MEIHLTWFAGAMLLCGVVSSYRLIKRRESVALFLAAVRLQNTNKICQEEMTKAVKQDIDNHDPSGSMAKALAWREKTILQDYASDFTNLHTSLIYRLGVAERDADGDYALKQLLNPDPTFFNCWYFKRAGDYFYNLGNKLKAKGD